MHVFREIRKFCFRHIPTCTVSLLYWDFMLLFTLVLNKKRKLPLVSQKVWRVLHRADHLLSWTLTENVPCLLTAFYHSAKKVHRIVLKKNKQTKTHQPNNQDQPFPYLEKGCFLRIPCICLYKSS